MQRTSRKIVSLCLAICMLFSLAPISAPVAAASGAAAPEWSAGYPRMGDMSDTSGEIEVRMNKSGRVYYVVLPAGASAPLAMEVKAGTGRNGAIPVTAGSQSVAADAEEALAIAGLTDISLYDAYLVVEDDAFNMQQAPVRVRISTNILGYYNFEGNLEDQSGSGNHGTPIGTPSYASGFAGQGLSLNGSSGLVLPYDLLRSNKTFTVTMRFKTTGTGSLLGYQNSDVSGSPTQWIPIIYIDKYGKLNAMLYVGPEGYGYSLRVTTDEAVNDDRWHKVTVTATADSVSIYIDDQAPETASGEVSTFEMSNNQIGVAFNDDLRDANVVGEKKLDYYTGDIDDVFIISKGIDSAGVRLLTDDAPKADTISVTNHVYGTPDLVTAAGLAPVDIVYVYDAPAGGNLLGTAAVQAGSTQAQVIIPQLGSNSGHVYVSVAKSGDNESTRTQVSYISEAAQAANHDIALARLLLPDHITASPDSDTNLLAKLHAIAGIADTGVTLSLHSNHSQIAGNGDITYAAGELTGDVLVYINKADGTQDSKIMIVTVQAAEPSNQPDPPGEVEEDLDTNFITFKYDTFSNDGRLITNGSTAYVNNRLRLTPALGDRWGTAFNEDRVSLKDERSFSTYFTFEITNGGGYDVGWADGIVFAVQTYSNRAGQAGGGMGYQGILESVGIEFDTWDNGAAVNDPSANHVAINVNGDITNTNNPVVHVSGINMKTGTIHGWVDYDGLNKTIEVRMNQNNNTRPTDPIIQQTNFNLTQILTSDNVYVGFTAATGGAYQNHDITSWYFTNGYAPIDVRSTNYEQAPTSYVMTSTPQEDGRVKVDIQAVGGSKRDGVRLSVSGTNGAAAMPNSVVTDGDGKATVYMESPSGTVTTTVRVEGPAGIYSEQQVTIPGKTAAPLASNIVANATDGTVAVTGVPEGAAATLYDHLGNILFTQSDVTGGTITFTNVTDMTIEEDIMVAFDVAGQAESERTAVRPKVRSDAVPAADIHSNGTQDVVYVTAVPPGAVIRVYDADGVKIGEGTNVGSDDPYGVDVISGLTDLQAVQVSIQLVHELESARTSVTTILETSAAPFGAIAAAQLDVIRVQHVPNNAKVIVYSTDGEEVASIYNRTGSVSTLEVDMFPPGFDIGDLFDVSIIEVEKYESEKVRVQGKVPGAPLVSSDLKANGTQDDVIVQDVPAGSIIHVYDTSGNLIGQAAQVGDTTRDLTISIAGGLADQQKVRVTITRPGHLESSSVEVTAMLESSAIPADIIASATADKVIVKDVPAGALVKVYDQHGELLAAEINSAGSSGEVTIVIPGAGLELGDQVSVTFTELEKYESAAVSAVAGDQSASLSAVDITADGTAGTVTLADVPAGATIILYDEDGHVLGQATQGPEAGPLMITGLAGLGINVDVTITEEGKLESEPVRGPVSYDASDALAEAAVSANASDDTVTVRDVPAGAMITVYDAVNNVIGTATNTGETAGPVVVVIDAPGLGAGDVVEVTIRERNKLESARIEVTAVNAPSDGLPAEAITTNATEDTVTVKDVPPGATVTVYDGEGNELGTATNTGDTTGEVTVQLNIDIAVGDEVEVSITLPGRDESPAVPSIAQEESDPVPAADITADGTAGTITIGDVPAGATIILYDEDGHVLGQATQGPEAGPLTITGLAGLGNNVDVTITEEGKLESEPVRGPVSYDASDALAEAAVSANASDDTVTVIDVPAGATITVYDAENNVIGTATNTGETAGPVVVVIDAPGLGAGDVVEVTIRERNKLESARIEVTAVNAPSDGLPAEAITTNATDDTVTVKDVPPGATVTVYDGEGNELGTATNTGDTTGEVTVQLNIDIAVGDEVEVSITLPGRDESPAVPSIAQEESDPVPAADITADGTAGTITIGDVPAGAKITVYDEAGHVLGQATQGPEAGPLTITGLAVLGNNVDVTITEEGKLESEPVRGPVSYDASDALAEAAVSANASDDTVTVIDVPAGATITVYDAENNVIGTATNTGETAGPVVVVIDAPGLGAGDVVEVTIRERNMLESARTEVTAVNAPSDGLPAEAITTNATEDTVTVKDVPPGATVTVYDGEGNELGTATNTGETIGEVTVQLNIDIADGDEVEVSITLPGRDESPAVPSIAKHLSAELDVEQISANATTDTVTVSEVPAGAEIRVYNAVGEWIGSAINGNDELAEVIILISAPGLAHGDLVYVNLKEVGKLESASVSKVSAMERTVAPLLDHLTANASNDRISVEDVPAGATVKIYDLSGNLLVSRKNTTSSASKLDLLMIPGFAAGTSYRVTLTETGRTESAYTVVTALDQSPPLSTPNIADIDLENDQIVVQGVPAGATIIVYDANGNEIGRATNDSGGTAEVTVTGPITTSVVTITIVEAGKLESEPLAVDLLLTTAEQIDDALRRLTVGFQALDTWESVTQSVFLLTVGAHETDVDWSSSKPLVITVSDPVDGTIEAYVDRQENDESVILTATVSKNGISKSRTFLLIVKSTRLSKISTQVNRQVDVNGGADQDVTEQVDIHRITMSDGSKIDKTIFDASSADNFVRDPRTLNSAAKIIVDELEGDEADEFAIEVPRQSVALLTANGNTLEIHTDYGRIIIDPAELTRMNDSYLDLFFRFVPVKNPDKQARLNEQIPNEPEVRSAAGNRIAEVIGSSLEIETNYSDYSTALFIPFAKNGIEVPARNTDAFLNALRIYIEHSDGDKEVTPGTVVYEAGVPIGLEIEIDKFSTFSIIQLKARPSTDSDDAALTAEQPLDILTAEVDVERSSITLHTEMDPNLIDIEGFTVKLGEADVEIEEVVIDGQMIIIRLKQPVRKGYPLTVAYSSEKRDKLQTMEAVEIPNEAHHTAYIHGYADGTFKPNQAVKRSEMAAMLVRVNQLTKSGAYRQVYPDVPQSHWAVGEIERLEELKWFVGDDQGSFRPNDRIRRAEMAIVVAKWLELDMTAAQRQSTFSDVASNHWASGAIAAVHAAKIMIGYEGNQFRPNAYLTRAEAVAIINSALNRGPLLDVPAPTWPDVKPDHWAYGHIEEASLNHSYMYKVDESGEQFLSNE